MNSIVALPITAAMPIASPSLAAPVSEANNLKQAAIRLEQAIELLRTRYVCEGWKMDEAYAERALRYVRRGCPEDDEEWSATCFFITHHGLSYDWIFDGNPTSMICELAHQSKQGRATASTADPIFEAVALHRAAYTALDEALKRLAHLEDTIPRNLRKTSIDNWEVKIVETDDPRWIAIEQETHRLHEAETDAACALVDVEPTTLLGAAHLIGYVVEREARGDEWPQGLVGDDAPQKKYGEPWSFFLHRNLADFIGKIAIAA